MVGSNGGKLVWTGYATDLIKNITLEFNISGANHGSKSLSIPQCDYITFVYYWTSSNSATTMVPYLLEYSMCKGLSVSFHVTRNSYPILTYADGNNITALVSLSQDGTVITFDINSDKALYNPKLFTTIYAYKY